MNQIVLRESDISGIISIGMCDGGYSSKSYTYPIPGNNEGIETMIFFNSFYSRYILLKKFKNIILWYSTVCNTKVRRFEELDLFGNLTKKCKYLPLQLIVNVDASKLFNDGIRLCFFKIFNTFNELGVVQDSLKAIRSDINRASRMLYLENFFFENIVSGCLYNSFVKS